MDWDAARGHLRSAFKVIRDDDNAFAVQVGLKREAGEITQDLGLASTRLHGRSWLEIIAPLCRTEKLNAPTIVAYQDRLAFGAIVLRGNTYLLRYGVALESLVPQALGWTISIMAAEAAKLRESLRVPAEASTFAHYTEE